MKPTQPPRPAQSSVRVENRLVMYYLFGDIESFDKAWYALARLHVEACNPIFLYQYGIRMLKAPRLLADTRLLALVVREQDLRDADSAMLARLVDILLDGEAAFIERIPHQITAWIADLTEWREGLGEWPVPPRGVALTTPLFERID